MGICGTAKPKEKVRKDVENNKNDESKPTLIALYETGNQEQKEYCNKIVDNFKTNKNVKFQIKSIQYVPFSIRFRVNGKTTEVQNEYDYSEKKMKETLQKIYDLLK